jgi:hypothetical protein
VRQGCSDADIVFPVVIVHQSNPSPDTDRLRSGRSACRSVAVGRERKIFETLMQLKTITHRKPH